MAEYGTWTEVKAAIKAMIAEMTIANGFEYDWAYHNRTDIHQPEDIYVSMDTPEGEENNDEDGGVGVNQYENERQVEFYLFLKNDTAPAELDDVIEDVEDKLELALDDFKLKFNSTRDDGLCSAGVKKAQYRTMKWVGLTETESKAGRYAPIKMKVFYQFVYKQSRGLV